MTATNKPPEREDYYRPYFYQAGHYLWKPFGTETALQKIYKGQSGVYDFTSEPPVFYHPQTVEQVIQRGYLAVRGSEPETAILSDKHGTFWQGLDDIIRQVRRRYAIYDKHLYQIEQGKCYAISTLYQVEAHRGGVAANSRERYSLTKRLEELYQQEREERVGLWQDVSKLKLLLPETAQQYLSAHRKMSILRDQRSDWN